MTNSSTTKSWWLLMIVVRRGRWKAFRFTLTSNQCASLAGKVLLTKHCYLNFYCCPIPYAIQISCVSWSVFSWTPNSLPLTRQLALKVRWAQYYYFSLFFFFTFFKFQIVMLQLTKLPLRWMRILEKIAFTMYYWFSLGLSRPHLSKVFIFCRKYLKCPLETGFDVLKVFWKSNNCIHIFKKKCHFHFTGRVTECLNSSFNLNSVLIIR